MYSSDSTPRPCPFLLLTAFLWTVAGLYGRAYFREDERRGRFFAFYLAAMSGNLGLILARDIASFHLFYSLMSLATYGLVVYDATPAAERAGRVYIVTAVLGEVLLFAAVLVVASITWTVDLHNVAAGVAGAGGTDRRAPTAATELHGPARTRTGATRAAVCVLRTHTLAQHARRRPRRASP